jgi:hypothetical protein
MNRDAQTALPGDYVAGLVDGEGCFSLTYRRIYVPRKSSREYFYWFAQFAIVMHRREEPILRMVQHTLGCGHVTGRTSTARYAVTNVPHLAGKIVPFFTTFRLRAAKASEFALWSNAVELIVRHHRAKGQNAAPKRRGFQPHIWPAEDEQEILALWRQLVALKGSLQRYKRRPPDGEARPTEDPTLSRGILR